MRRFLANWVAILMVAAVPGTGLAQNPRFEQARISAEEWAAYQDEVLARVEISAGASVKKEGGLTVIEVPEERAIYLFTLPEHPAHPAVARRVLWQRNGRTGILGRGHFAGSREEFVTWYRGIEELNERTSQQWRRFFEEADTPSRRDL